MSEGAICVICYEDARPLCEDLQSISACGHVFHELCLQQWIEYCPAGRKPTCPLCKKSCTSRDVHRLYFQSAVNDSTQPPSENLQAPVADPNQVDNAPALRKLECQLAAAKTTLQNRNEQLKELDSQVVANLRRAESAEAANVVVKELLVHCKKKSRQGSGGVKMLLE